MPRWRTFARLTPSPDCRACAGPHGTQRPEGEFMKPTLKPRSSFHDVRANRGPPIMLDGDWAVPKATGTTGRHLRGYRKWYDGRRGRDGLTRPGRGIPSVSESVDSGCYEAGPGWTCLDPTCLLTSVGSRAVHAGLVGVESSLRYQDPRRYSRTCRTVVQGGSSWNRSCGPYLMTFERSHVTYRNDE